MANETIVRTMEVTGYSIQNPLSSVVKGSEEKNVLHSKLLRIAITAQTDIHTYIQYDVVGFRDDLVPRI